MEPPALERPPVTSDCNECNEALDAARGVIQTVRRLALVAKNALLNRDLPRARTAIRDLHDVTLTPARALEKQSGES
jgi:hypothetical protein